MAFLGQAVKLIEDNFFDAICREKEGAAETAVDIELPYQSKKALDQWRNKVLPTVPLHHRLRVFAPRFLDLMEKNSCPVTRGRGSDLPRIWKET